MASKALTIIGLNFTSFFFCRFELNLSNIEDTINASSWPGGIFLVEEDIWEDLLHTLH